MSFESTIISYSGKSKEKRHPLLKLAFRTDGVDFFFFFVLLFILNLQKLIHTFFPFLLFHRCWHFIWFGFFENYVSGIINFVFLFISLHFSQMLTSIYCRKLKLSILTEKVLNNCFVFAEVFLLCYIRPTHQVWKIQSIQLLTHFLFSKFSNQVRNNVDILSIKL